MSANQWTTAGIVMLVAAVALFGCKAKPMKQPTGFIEGAGGGATSEQRDLYPFHQAWFQPGWNAPRYGSIVIAPVNVDYLKKEGAWAKTNLKGARLEKDTANLAAMAQEAFQNAFREDEASRFQVVDAARGDSLVLELALVEVVPNKAVLGALGFAATAASMGAAGIAAKEVGKGSVAVEGRVRQSDTGEIVAKFADREKGKFGPINLRRATWYGEQRKIIREWADQCEKVKDTKTFTLRPW
jgi:hypothetical protein